MRKPSHMKVNVVFLSLPVLKADIRYAREQAYALSEFLMHRICEHDILVATLYD